MAWGVNQLVAPALAAVLVSWVAVSSVAASEGESPLVERGRDLVSQGKLAEAEEAYREALKALPDSLPALRGLGFAYLKQEKFPECIEVMKRANAIEEHARSYTILGTAQAHLSRFKQAIPVLERAVELDARDGYAHRELGYCYFSTGRHADAVRAYERARQLLPEVPHDLLHLGIAYRATDQPDRATAAFERALKVAQQQFAADPEKNNARTQMAEALAQLGRHAEAVATLKAESERHPDRHRAYSTLGVVYTIAGRFDEAVEPFRRGAELAGTTPWAHVRHVHALFAAGRDADTVAAAGAFERRFGGTHPGTGGMLRLAYFALRRGGGDAEARVMLDRAAAVAADHEKRQDKLDDWPAALDRFLRGDTDAAAMLEAGRAAGQESYARTCLGLHLSLGGAAAGAKEHLDWVLANNDVTSTDHALAASELKRVEAAAATDVAK